MAPTHVADVDIDRFRQRRLPADALVTFTDHLALCGDCRRRVAGRTDVAAASASLQETLGIGGDDHIAESEIGTFVDGGLDSDRRTEISTHLSMCSACAEEVRDLQAFAAQFRRPSRFRSPWIYGVLAAAAVVVVGVALAVMSRAQSRRGDAALARTTAGVTRDAAGSRPGVEALEPADGARVRDALGSGRLSLPSALADLAGRRGALMGPAVSPAFHLTSPIATVVLGDRPALRWTALPGATTYVVTLQDQSNGETMSSPPLTRVGWTPERPLMRGRIYAWQVAGSIGGTEIVAPRPPDPPAQFMIAEASEADRLERLPASHLLRGVLYAQAGLLDDAERELGMVAAGSPGANRVEAFLEQLHHARAPH